MLHRSLILQLFGFKSHSILHETSGKQTFEFMIFNSNKYIEAKLLLSIKRISNLYVYSDIV